MALWWINDSGENTLRGEPAYEAADGTVFRNEIEAQNYSAMTGQSFTVWLDDDGNPGNPENPLRLYNAFILHCLHTVPPAREDFYKILPTLTSAEQTRLNRMLDTAPFVVASPLEEPQLVTDRFANRFNRAGVRVSGPLGGTRRG